jgi:cytochrome P450
MVPAFDLFAPDVLADPYPLYHALRAEVPVWRAPEGQWVLTRHADVAAALHDPRLQTGLDFGRVQAFPEPLRETVAALMRPLTAFMVSCNPPEHTRLRGLVNKALTPHAVEALRPQIQARVASLLDAVVARADPSTGEGRCDVIADFAYPLPVTVVSILLGLPAGSAEQFREWAYDLSVLWGPPSLPDVADRVQRCERSVAALRAFFGDLIAERRASPTNDLLSALIAAKEDGAVLSDEELLWNSVLLLLAGHETATDLIGNGLLALLRNPDQMQKLRQEPSLVPGAVEELLRYDAPFQFMQREAKEDVRIGGVTVRGGERVWLMLGAACRDPAVYPDPDRLDVTRPHHSQLAFGVGIHFCPGAPLARLEGQVAFPALLERLATIRLETEKLEWLPKLPNRGLKALPVVFRGTPD